MEQPPEQTIISEELARKIIEIPKTVSMKDYLADGKITRNGSIIQKTIPVKCEKYDCEIKIRQATDNPLNFSVILLYDKRHIILRYNGNHGRHVNKIENNILNGPHIHRITERYQLLTHHPDGYATATDAYRKIDDALETFMKEINTTLSD